MKPCETIEQLLPDYTVQRLSAEQNSMVVRHLASCNNCSEVLIQMQHLIQQMQNDEIVVPATTLRNKFLGDLQLAKASEILPDKISSGKLADIFRLKYVVAASVILLIGISIGVLIMRNNAVSVSDIGRQMAQVQQELADIKKVTVLNLLKEESAGDRLKAVNYADEIESPDTALVTALVKALNEDESVHVRIAAASCLENFSGQPVVMDALLQSLSRQHEPMVQIVLMHILTRKNERRALQPIENIWKSKTSDDEVRKTAQKSISILS